MTFFQTLFQIQKALTILKFYFFRAEPQLHIIKKTLINEYKFNQILFISLSIKLISIFIFGSFFQKHFISISLIFLFRCND